MEGLKIHGEITITIGGKKRSFRFGLWLLMKIAERNNGMNIYQFVMLGKTNPLKYFGELLYLGGLLHSKKSGDPIDYDEVDVYDWIDFDDPELAKLVHCFNDSVSFNGKTITQLAEEEMAKKKPTATKTKTTKTTVRKTGSK